MKLQMYSIFDQAAKAFAQPFFMHNDGLAIRAFQDNANSADSQIAKHPDQFTLYNIGTYDDQTGQVDTVDPKSLGIAQTYIQPEEQNTLMQELIQELKQQRALKEQAA